jgi:hypothetical protein
MPFFLNSLLFASLRYYAFDDDYVRSSYTVVNNQDEYDREKLCRRASEHRLNFQNCNSFHESPLLELNVKYLRYVIAILVSGFVTLDSLTFIFVF